MLNGCVSTQEFVELRKKVSQLESRLSSENSIINSNVSTVAGKLNGLDGRISRLENELEGTALRTVTLRGDGEWHVIFANQSGSNLSLSVKLDCIFVNRACRTNSSDGEVEIRILSILATADDTLSFPVVENAVTVDTGPLELTLPGTVRRIVLPRGFHILARSRPSNDVRIRLLIE